MSDTRNFKHFRPPADAFLDCGKAWALVRRIRLPEHDVVRSALRDEHCIVSRCEPAGTDDAFGFELLDRVGKGLDAGEMSTVGASTRDEIGAALKQKCATSALCGNREGLGTIDQRALIDFDKAQQNGRDVASLEGGCQLRRNRRCLRNWRCSEIEEGRRTWTGRFGSRNPCPRMLDQSSVKFTRRVTGHGDTPHRLSATPALSRSPLSRNSTGRYGIGTGPMSFGTL